MQNQSVSVNKPGRRDQKQGGFNHKEIFFYLLILTGFFLILEISFFIQCTRVYLADFMVVAHHLNLPLTLLPEILFFLLAQFIVHCSFCLIIFFISFCFCQLFAISAKRQLSLSIAIWVLGILTILLANQFYFPYSKFAELTKLLFWNEAILQFFLVMSCSIVSILLILVLCYLLKLIMKQRFLLFISVIGLLTVSGSLLKPSKNSPPHFPSSLARPTIILIGIDSLRPDFLGYFGADTATPFLDRFLQQSAVFGEALTPLARTFPSWTSILTGKYPRLVGIRSNLAPQTKTMFANSLPAILKRAGYYTLYATDETRFSNIDERAGFDKIVSPPMGLNDFLLGTFNDFPLSNLIINTKVGHYLFPYSYGNRPVFFTYSPSSFLRMVDAALDEAPPDPLFLSIHFCLPHSPYLWYNAKTQSTEVARYRASIVRTDRQIADLMRMLKKSQLLTHAIVVLLSDHGEALELSGDRITEADKFANHSQPAPKFYPPSLDNEKMDESIGHGTDVLGLTQYHSLLAFQFYGLTNANQARLVPGVVTLLDIKPTLLDQLKLFGDKEDGISLLPLITSQTASAPLRHVFLESDLSPVSIRTIYPQMHDVLLEGMHIFETKGESKRLTVRPTMAVMILKSKQFADVYGDWILALYPRNQTERLPILVNLKTGIWTNDLNSQLALHSPAQSMLKALKNFYRDEIINVSQFPQ